MMATSIVVVPRKFESGEFFGGSETLAAVQVQTDGMVKRS